MSDAKEAMDLIWSVIRAAERSTDPEVRRAIERLPQWLRELAQDRRGQP